MGRYRSLVDSGSPILTDGATGTRIRLETRTALDPVLDIASVPSLGMDHVLRAIAGEYVAIARACALPIELDAMTYWASPDHLLAAGRSDECVTMNRDCVRAIIALKEMADVYIAGVIGPRADGYRSGPSMSADEAANYHIPQAAALAASGADLIFGSTMSSADEALGVAMAAAATGIDYVIGFVVDDQGNLPGGTSLTDAVQGIDALGDDRPVHYLLTCTHPTTALNAMRRLRDLGADRSDRVIGIKGNGARADADALETTERVLTDPPLSWAEATLRLRDEFDFRILGGCCGTDSRHILALALAMTNGRA
jgi:S-methylmethionine-dependent homocysteine/selenocysteine methylase